MRQVSTKHRQSLPPRVAHAGLILSVKEYLASMGDTHSVWPKKRKEKNRIETKKKKKKKKEAWVIDVVIYLNFLGGCKCCMMRLLCDEVLEARSVE